MPGIERQYWTNLNLRDTVHHDRWAVSALRIGSESGGILILCEEHPRPQASHLPEYGTVLGCTPSDMPRVSQGIPRRQTLPRATHYALGAMRGYRRPEPRRIWLRVTVEP